MKNNKQPEIRFPGFTEDWEERKLGDGVYRIGDGLHGTPNYTETGDVYFINGNNLVDGKILITKETKRVTSTEQSKDDKALNDNTLLMSINGTIGNLAWYCGEKLMLGKSAAYITVSSFDKKFIYSYLQTSKVHSHFMNSLTGTTIKNLGLKTIRETQLLIPDLDEQKKIGSFFKQLDDTIALHQRELASLQQTKQGFLQKMFPKEGEKVPEIRFPGFTEDWEQRKLGDEVENIGTGRSNFITSIERSSETPYAVLGSTSVISYDREFDHSGDFILTARVGANAGNLYKHSGDVKISDNTVYIQSKSLDFAYYLLKKFDLKRLSFGTGQPLVKASELKNLKLMFPKDKEEQAEIGVFFAKLDDTIALHQRELELLKETKKAFLQKLFV